MPKRPTIVAHRGLHGEVPENSLAAMRAAWAAGVRWAECDVHESPVGFVVLHDDSLDRTTDASGPIADFPHARPDTVRLRDGAGGLTDHTLPWLGDLVAAVPAGCGLLVEIKAVSDYRLFAAKLHGHRVWVQSFNPRDLRIMSRQDRTIPLAYLVETAAESAAAVGTHCGAVHLRHDLLDAHVVRRLRGGGKSIGVWTVNAEADLRRVIGLGVDTIITDEPVLAMRVADELCGP